MKNGNGYQTVADFCRVLLTIKENPGLLQIDLARLLNLDRAKVSRLTNIGIQNKIIARNGRHLYKGPALENRLSI